MKKSTAPEPGPVKESLPTRLEVKIHSLRTDGPVLAHASVTLNGCFAVRGLRVVDSENGPFVSMPRYKSGNEYQDICFPCTKSSTSSSIKRCWTHTSRHFPSSPSGCRKDLNSPVLPWTA